MSESLAQRILKTHPYTGMPDGPPLCLNCSCRECCEEHPHVVQWPCVTAREVFWYLDLRSEVTRDGERHLYRSDGAEWPDLWNMSGIEEWAGEKAER